MIKKLKNNEMLAIVNTINSLAEKTMPLKVSYALLQNSKEINSNLEIYNSKLKELADADGKISTDKMSELSELLELETEVNLQLVSFEDLEKCELSLKEVAALEPLINAETEN